MLGQGLFFSPVQPPPKRNNKRPPWAAVNVHGNNAHGGDDGDDPNGRDTASTRSRFRSRAPDQEPDVVVPAPDLAPDLAPASFSASSSSCGSPIGSNNLEHNTHYASRLLRRRRNRTSEVSARPIVGQLQAPLSSELSDEVDCDCRRRDRRAPKRWSDSTLICRVCASLAIFALCGIIFVVRLALLSKPSNSDAPATIVEPVDASSLLHTPRTLPVSNGVDRPEAVVAVQDDLEASAGEEAVPNINSVSVSVSVSESDSDSVSVSVSVNVGDHGKRHQHVVGNDRLHQAIPSEAQRTMANPSATPMVAPQYPSVLARKGLADAPLLHTLPTRQIFPAPHGEDWFEGEGVVVLQDDVQASGGEEETPTYSSVSGGRTPSQTTGDNHRVHQVTGDEARRTASEPPVPSKVLPQFHHVHDGSHDEVFESDQPVVATKDSRKEEQCWIFMYMEEGGGGGGGATARNIASNHWRRDEVIFDNVQWRRGDSYASDVMTRSRWRLLHGGCVESLRRHSYKGGKTCKWFTVFRHPVARLLSAFDHCRDAPQDPLCASTTGTTTDDLVTFAEHWGNFGLRQFAMSAVSSDVVKKWAEKNHPGTRGVSVWSLLKGFLNQGGGTRDGGEGYLNFGGDTRDGVKGYLNQGGVTRDGVEGYLNQGEGARDRALEGLLEPIKGLLRTQYAAVGIASELNTTMLLFDKALSMPNLNWSAALKSRTAVGVHETEYDRPGQMTQREALANPRIASALRLDILLYEHAAWVFHEQVRHYGIV